MQGKGAEQTEKGPASGVHEQHHPSHGIISQTTTAGSSYNLMKIKSHLSCVDLDAFEI